jgi:hypothetical protein
VPGRLSLFPISKFRISYMQIGQSLRGRDALEPFFACELPTAIRSALWDLLCEAAERRHLTRMEIKIRCAIRPRPWREAGVDRSTYYRRLKRGHLAADRAQAA